MKHKQNTKRSGFTLVEIMIVVSIIALLAAIAVPNFIRSRKRSQATQILDELRMKLRSGLIRARNQSHRQFSGHLAGCSEVSQEKHASLCERRE